MKVMKWGVSRYKGISQFCKSNQRPVNLISIQGLKEWDLSHGISNSMLALWTFLLAYGIPHVPSRFSPEPADPMSRALGDLGKLMFLLKNPNDE